MSTTDGGGALSAAPRKTFLGHPRGLVVLFLTEMWERFSYYGMRALLVLYLTQHFLFGPREAQGIYAAYAALVYLMPVVGGMIADKYLGSRKAVIIGAVLLVAGHFTMAFEGKGGRENLTIGATTYELQVEGRDQNRTIFAVNGDERTQITISPEGVSRVGAEPAAAMAADVAAPAVAPAAGGFPAFTATDGYKLETVRDLGFGEPVLFFALSLIIVGVGFLKANISTVVGALYEENDPRRDGGFTIFYVGINLGSVLATAACSYLGMKYGWAYGFGLAGIGMLLGLITFILGQSWLEGRGGPPNPVALKSRKVLGVPFEAIFWIGGLVAVFPVWLLMQRHHIIETALPWLAGVIFASVVGYVVFKLRGSERSRMLVALALIFFSVLFWALFEQAGSSLTLFADQSTAMPSWFNAPMTQMFNPGIIVIGGPIIAALWVWLGKRNMEPSTPVKFSFALVLVGAGFLLLTWASATQANVDFRVPLIFLFLTYFLHTMGELCLSPVGLSMITKLSVDRVVGLMMGVWFLSSSVAHIAAGFIAQATSTATVAGVVTSPELALQTYGSIFGTIGWTGVVVGVVLLVLSPLLKKGMAGVH
ncbi:POT family proton-dependent oligopeptide transporter [Brevundimonas bullata]|uniref:POT family proton-dependent oligopeptide transporter n=1 Tax=Brevundimonas bullata TaxID=13160 RepID=A0A7W7N4I7_9CAUL|nr:oligopeptide:H+ symporter [Brevundimonas bullata]MBB4798302.1 POT family proton-dependent oligopeptide transporter [Brevundimonas bullata]MBB6383384.1 POT family proton-dependent oligopeptide transporter [Brevundimonas bullata]